LLLGYLDGGKRILGVYLAATTTRNESFDAEMIEVTLFMFQVVRIATPLTSEFLATLPPAEAKSPVRQKGLQQMRNGFATMVNGLLVTFTEKHLYRTTQLVRLAQGMKPILPDLLKDMPPLTQQEVPVRLRKLAEDENDPELKPALQDLLNGVQRALRDAGSQP
jgi:hypothetical protein